MEYKDQVLDEAEPECEHKFFKCQVPAGDSCQPIYHQVCRLCRWDKTKGCVMPDEVWTSWAIPYLSKGEKEVGHVHNRGS